MEPKILPRRRTLVVAALTLIALWVLLPSSTTLDPLDELAMRCLLVVVAAVHIAHWRALPPKEPPIMSEGHPAFRVESAADTPFFRRARRAWYLSLLVLPVPLNRLYEPTTFGTLGGYFEWALVGTLLSGTWIMFVVALDN
ncbi:MAG: hypothetical protein ACYC6F_17265 [Longimicrobiales bacterium]